MTQPIEYLGSCLLCTNSTIIAIAIYLSYNKKYSLSYGLCEDCVLKESADEEVETIAKEIFGRIEQATNAENN